MCVTCDSVSRGKSCAAGALAVDSAQGIRWCCRSGTDLYRELDKCSIGDEVDLEILRGSEKVSLKVTLGSNN